jgi:hypothetical protein
MARSQGTVEACPEPCRTVTGCHSLPFSLRTALIRSVELALIHSITRHRLPAFAIPSPFALPLRNGPERSEGAQGELREGSRLSAASGLSFRAKREISQDPGARTEQGSAGNPEAAAAPVEINVIEYVTCPKSAQNRSLLWPAERNHCAIPEASRTCSSLLDLPWTCAEPWSG